MTLNSPQLTTTTIVFLCLLCVGERKGLGQVLLSAYESRGILGDVGEFFLQEETSQLGTWLRGSAKFSVFKWACNWEKGCCLLRCLGKLFWLLALMFCIWMKFDYWKFLVSNWLDLCYSFRLILYGMCVGICICYKWIWALVNSFREQVWCLLWGESFQTLLMFGFVGSKYFYTNFLNKCF